MGRHAKNMCLHVLVKSQTSAGKHQPPDCELREVELGYVHDDVMPSAKLPSLRCLCNHKAVPAPRERLMYPMVLD